MKRRYAGGAAISWWLPSMLLARNEDRSKSTLPAVKRQTEWGAAGSLKAAWRNIRIAMTDNMQFTPDKVAVKQGETVKFLIVNEGKLDHEVVLGTKPVLDKLVALVAKSPHEVDHERAHRLHVDHGKTGEQIWNFNRAGACKFARLFPGQHQAGMIDRINVAAAQAKG